MAGTAPTGCNDADAGDAQHNADPPRTSRENDDADLDELLNENDSGGSAGIDTDDTPDAPNPKPEVMNDESVPAVAAQPIKEGPRSEDTPASAEGVSGIAAPGVGSTDKATADTDVSTSNTSASAAQEEDGGWGLSSVTAALGGGWGFGAGADPGVESATTGTEEGQQDDEWKHQAETIEETAAAAVAAASSFFSGTAVTGTTSSSTEETEAAPAREAKEDKDWNETAENVEHVIEDATAAAAAAASSFFSGATEYLTGGSATAAEAAPEATTASTSTSADPTAAALRSLADLNPMSKLASGWIDDLEKQNAESDPHRKLRDHLDGHLGEWPRSSYEEWVEEALRVLDGWDDGSAVVDDTFYMEDSVHRNIWNERNAEDDDGVECKREYVSARKPTGSTDASGSSATKAVPKTMDKKKTAEVVSSGDSEDADLAGLLGDEEEIVFVDAPKSG